LKRGTFTVIADKFYYIDGDNNLCEGSIVKNYLTAKKISKVAYNSFFRCENSTKYLICNLYKDKKIIEVDGCFYEMSEKRDVINYGIHRDKKTGYWLLIFEYSSGEFNTFIFNSHNLIYRNDSIKYLCDLGSVCIKDSTLYIPKDGGIIGFNYVKNTFKTFNLDMVSSDSKIYFDIKMRVISDKKIYELGKIVI
jgi:hypothetical protein